MAAKSTNTKKSSTNNTAKAAKNATTKKTSTAKKASASTKKSGIFALSLLDVECSFETIKHFGFQSGRDVDKMKDLTLPVDQNNIPYMGYQACAVISGKVLEQQDLGTHTLFIAEVTDAKLLNENAPLTYADYQNRVKPKKKEIPQDKKIVGWRCKICNYVYEGSELPADYICPICGHDVSDFEPIFEN